METVKIEYLYDPDTDMESLSINGKCVGFGNSHDNHCDDRLNAIKRTFDILGIKYSVEENLHWVYE